MLSVGLPPILASQTEAASWPRLTSAMCYLLEPSGGGLLGKEVFPALVRVRLAHAGRPARRTDRRGGGFLIDVLQDTDPFGFREIRNHDVDVGEQRRFPRVERVRQHREGFGNLCLVRLVVREF